MKTALGASKIVTGACKVMRQNIVFSIFKHNSYLNTRHFREYIAAETAIKNAGAAVRPNRGASRGGFTLLEVLVVVVLIGILSALAYSSLMDIILTNRAKEAAQTMRSFAERAQAEAKRQGATAEVKLTAARIEATINGAIISESLGSGFSASSPSATGLPAQDNKNTAGMESALNIGLSGFAGEEGHFAACNARGYCGAAVKTKSDNSFQAWVKKGSNASWGEL